MCVTGWQDSPPSLEGKKYSVRVIDHFSFLENICNEQEKEVRAVYRDAHFLAAVSDELSDAIREFISDDQNVITVVNVLGRQFEHQQAVKRRLAWPC